MLCSRHAHHHLGHRSWLRCYYWPQAVVGGPCDGCLSLQLQPATLAPTSSPLVVRECHQDARPGVHSVSSWLLQLTAVWHERRTTSTLPVSAERCRPPGHRRSSEWLHHTSVTAATLTASSSANGVQDHGARASVARRSCYRVPCGRFSPSVGRWSSPCDPVLFTCGSCICSKHTINLATGVSRPLVLDCGMTFQLDCTSQDCPQVPSDDLQNLIYLATAAPSDSFELIGAYNNVIYIPKFRLTVRKTHLPIGWASYRSNTRLSSHPSWILCEYWVVMLVTKNKSSFGVLTFI